jgi:hypothetical protein
LVDDLISGIEFRHDEVAGRPVGEHPHGKGVVVGPHARKAGEQTVVEVDNSSAGVFPDT